MKKDVKRLRGLLASFKFDYFVQIKLLEYP